jgi:hypothetical protein
MMCLIVSLPRESWTSYVALSLCTSNAYFARRPRHQAGPAHSLYVSAKAFASTVELSVVFAASPHSAVESQGCLRSSAEVSCILEDGCFDDNGFDYHLPHAPGELTREETA